MLLLELWRYWRHWI